MHYCVKCKHEWKGRKQKKPKLCPSCHSPNWEKSSEKDFVSLLINA